MNWITLTIGNKVKSEQRPWSNSSRYTERPHFQIKLYITIKMHGGSKIMQTVGKSSFLLLFLIHLDTYSFRLKSNRWPAFFNKAWASLLSKFLVEFPFIALITSPSLIPFWAALLPGLTWNNRPSSDYFSFGKLALFEVKKASIRKGLDTIYFLFQILTW